jgi:hypothetical protein
VIIDLEALRGLESQLDACHCFGKISTSSHLTCYASLMSVDITS